MIIVGIDPGLNGALAVLAVRSDHIELDTIDMPTLEVNRRRRVDAHQLSDILSVAKEKDALCVIEHVASMPKQGVASTFSFGQSFGLAEGVAIAHGYRVELIRPAQWKRMMRVASGKDAARARASELFPDHTENWRLKKHDGRAEAALLAQWGLKYAA